MLTLFEPQSKVQKDRQIIRKTDKRMAKYSRRGLITNFLIYTLCLLFGQEFIEQQPHWAIGLTIGLLLLTLLRGYLLFRFEAIYARGPAAWRNKYFVVTLLGATWWGVIMGSLTLVLGMTGEASLLWLYTVVFFSTTAHAFAPYKRFLTIYQFLGIVPAAICTFFIGELVGLFYGCILLMFYWILNHQCELMARDYWERLEANYTLARRTQSLEEEKRDTRASVRISNEYLTLLSQQMHALIALEKDGDGAQQPGSKALQQMSLETLYRNVDDFHKVIAKELNIEASVFNVRHYIQFLTRDLIEQAERKGLELETALSPVLPARLIGDPQRLGQIILTMLRSAIEQTREGVLFMEVEFLREYENSGELHILVTRQVESSKRTFFQDSVGQPLQQNLDMLLATAMAEALDGSLDIGASRGHPGSGLRFRVPMRVAEPSARPEYHRLEYKGRPLLLIHPNARWLDHKRIELGAMGFDVQTANDFKKALRFLEEAVSSGKPVEAVVYTVLSGYEEAIHFGNELLGHNELKHLSQWVICSPLGEQYFASRLAQQASQVQYVYKPSGIFEFELVASRIFASKPKHLQSLDGEEREAAVCEVLWYAPKRNFDNAKLWETGAVQIHQAAEIKQIAKLLADKVIRLVVVEGAGAELLDGVHTVRAFEQAHQRESLLPIVAIGSKTAQKTIFESGADYFVDLEALAKGDTAKLDYWANVRNH